MGPVLYVTLRGASESDLVRLPHAEEAPELATQGRPVSRRHEAPFELSHEGMGDARPDVRVSTTDWARPGSVSSAPSAAAAAANEGTPGVTV